MSAAAAAAEMLSLRRFRDDQIVTLAKLVIENAFQPIVEATTGAVFGYETLMRGFERLGFNSPLELLDRAEATGQLLALEHMINSRAFAGFAGMPDFASRTLFVNFDARLIGMEDDIVERLSSHLKRAEIPPSSICFELSERFDNMRMPAFSDLIKRLRLAGFKLALDDFGVGFNGLKLLCDQPVDYVKIDRHFISGIDASPRKRHLVRHTVNTAHVLGTRVVAEGVETEAEFSTCRDLGCDLVQGYFVARPTVHFAELQPSYPHLVQTAEVRRPSASLDSILIRKQIEQVPAVNEASGLDSVFELFRKSPQRSFFPVLNANGEPRGVLHEYHVKEMIYHPFGRDLLKNHIYQRHIAHFVSPAPIADLETPAEEMLKIFAGMDGSDCVILTENMRYAGILSASSLLKIINEKQLKLAQEQNPLTGLPGNRAIRDYVQEAVLDGDEARYFCYCDFDSFKPFNDHYGFQKGDVAISLFAALMRRHFIGEEKFLGHVGGDDFFIGVRGWTRAELEALLTRILEEFRADIRQHYSAEHQAAGYMTGHGRNGETTYFPLMRCSIAVLELPQGFVFSDTLAVSTRIAEIKTHAKESDEGLVFDTFGHHAG
ncbi:diguanylate cyclase (GGDEF)-like protein [Pararhizobium capsulatum DSM 1112]|uniref:Diguanylate cyclase (GGDEF)-like protein n=1 Tax=Pararhizobium capsulatum DSM 1112 TaxID=1121113 RepID=A0ABU0BNG0_9HYPH|nr:bifunctional diguanylate cyclase/phosphodiesterase [Pararhizobium capsulatum]MDQ0319502.1 diguanylate cyclase (GGDEF)-like protein [Pararhizobium capsulatum DSM 1112]